MTHWSTYNIGYGQKKGWESKCQFDSRPLKVGNHLEYVHASGMPYIVEKISMKLKVCFTPHFNQRFAQEVMGFQSVGSLNFGNFKIPNFGVLRQNDFWVQPSWLITKNTIKGKVMVSPKFEP